MSRLPALDLCWNETDDIFIELDTFAEPLLVDKPEQLSDDLSPGLSHCGDGDIFDWESMKLSDTEQFFENISPIALPTAFDDVELPSPVSCVSEDVARCGTSNALLSRYGLSDEELGDISLKNLQFLCKTDDDYNSLKAYRRTCLNRHYARSSRNKLHEKTSGLAKKLQESTQEMARLQKENEMKDATIRCLQLELQLLRSMTRKSNPTPN